MDGMNKSKASRGIHCGSRKLTEILKDKKDGKIGKEKVKYD